MAERAHPHDPLWGRRFFFLPTPALSYLKRRYSRCRRLVAGRRVLDVPCGTGMGFPYLRRARDLIGVDMNLGALRFAATEYGRGAVAAADMTRLPFAAASFGAVICLEGIEHVDRRSGLLLLQEIARVLEPGGSLVLSCPLLRADRLHSANPYHLYEWRASELSAAVGSLFDIVEETPMRGPAGPVQIIVAKRTSSSQVATIPSTAGSGDRYVSAVEGVKKWVETRWCGSRAQYWRAGEPTLLATAFAVLVGESLGMVGHWPSERLAEAVAFILEHQEPESGRFGASLVRDEDLAVSSVCDRDYLIQQITYFCLSALTALGKEPRHRLRFAESYLDIPTVRDHINSGPWGDPWNQSNRVMFVLRFLIHLMREPQHADRARRAFDEVLLAIDEAQDGATGLWFGTGPRDLRRGVYAAFHFIPFILWRGRRPQRIDEMIDSVLEIQTVEGLFGEFNGGGACEDLDAVDLLVKLSYLSDYRTEDIRRGLIRAFDRILQLQHDDGGFPNYLKPEVVLSWKRRTLILLGFGPLLERWRPLRVEMSRYSGWGVVAAPRGEPDMWGTWFRVLALNLIVDRLPELGPAFRVSQFHELPALGWHDSSAIARVAACSATEGG